MDENQKADIIYHSSTDTLFYNSQCLFIEFHDVIEMPWLMLAYMLRNNKNTQKIFKIDELSSYSIQDFVEWYIYRKHRNIFKSIGVRDEIIDKNGDVPDEWYDQFLYNCMTNSEGLYMLDTKLIFYKSLNILLSDTPGMVKRIVIYSEKEEAGIYYFINEMLTFSSQPTKIEYLYGDFKEVIKDLPNDSTYIISDIEKINKIKEAEKLYMSSILVVNGLRYNYELHDKNKLKVDIPSLSKDIVFKCSFFDNFTTFTADERYRKIMNKK